MKCIIVMIACFVMADSHPFFGLDGLGKVGAELGSTLGSIFGSGIKLGIDTATNIGAGVASLGVGALEAGVGVVGAGAREVEEGANIAHAATTRFGNSALGIFGLGSKASSIYRHGASSEENQYNSAARGVESQAYHRGGRQKYHKHKRHHSSITKIEHTSTSDESDISESQSDNEDADRNSAFHKSGSGSRNYENSLEDEA